MNTTTTTPGTTRVATTTAATTTAMTTGATAMAATTTTTTVTGPIARVIITVGTITPDMRTAPGTITRHPIGSRAPS